MTETELIYVDGEARLGELARALEATAWHGLDTESNSGFAYTEKLCLLQLHVAERIWLVDLVALSGREGIEALRPSLEAPDKTTCLHGGEFDVGCFKRDYDLQLGGIWDTQQAASFLGLERTGYAAVVEAVTGVTLPKAFTQHDWAQRPLQEQVLEYAIDDVRYLPAVWSELGDRIAAADLEEELSIANQVVEAAIWDGAYRPDGFWRVKGAGSLSPSSLPVLSAVWQWRDATARDLDCPPGRALNNRLMLAIARNPPRNRQALKRLGVPGRMMRRAEQLLAVIQEARRSPAEVPPRPRNSTREPRLPGKVIRGREERLKAWRTEEAAQRGVPLQAVLPSRALEHLKRWGADELESVPQLGAKRVRLYGETLRRLVE